MSPTSTRITDRAGGTENGLGKHSGGSATSGTEPEASLMHGHSKQEKVISDRKPEIQRHQRKWRTCLQVQNQNGHQKRGRGLKN